MKELKIYSNHLSSKVSVSNEVYSAYMDPVWREKKQSQRRKALFEADNMSIVSIESIGSTIAAQDTPETIYLLKEQRREIMRAISALPAADAELIVWVYFEKRTLSDYSDKTGIPNSTLAYRHKRALKRLKEIFKNSIN